MREVDRRAFLKAVALSIGATAIPLAGGSAGAGRRRAASSAHLSAAQLVGGATFGISSQRRTGETQIQAILRMEQTAARTFDTVMNRMPWRSSPVNGYSRWIASSGHVPLLAWFTRKPATPWTEIANGMHDARIAAEADKLAAEGWPCYFAFHKEPENEPGLGDAAAFRAAHDRVWQLFQERGATNALFVPTLMASTFDGSFGGPERWLPAHFDAIGVDGYNRNINGTWRTFERIFRGAHGFAVGRGLPLMIVESGCVEGSSGQKAQWYADALATMRSWPSVVHYSYNDEVGGSLNDVNKNYRVDTSTSSIQGYRAMGADPHLNPAWSYAELAAAA